MIKLTWLITALSMMTVIHDWWEKGQNCVFCQIAVPPVISPCSYVSLIEWLSCFVSDVWHLLIIFLFSGILRGISIKITMAGAGNYYIIIMILFMYFTCINEVLACGAWSRWQNNAICMVLKIQYLISANTIVNQHAGIYLDLFRGWYLTPDLQRMSVKIPKLNIPNSIVIFIMMTWSGLLLFH